jgi:hypothetical protein
MGSPRNKHNDAYNALQENYLKTRDNRLLEKMYGIAREVAYNYIKNYCKRKGIRLNIEDKSHDSATFVIDKYLKHPEFKVFQISVYTYYGVKKALFGNKDTETKETSYEAYMENTGDFLEEIYMQIPRM